MKGFVTAFVGSGEVVFYEIFEKYQALMRRLHGQGLSHDCFPDKDYDLIMGILTGITKEGHDDYECVALMAPSEERFPDGLMLYKFGKKIASPVGCKAFTTFAIYFRFDRGEWHFVNPTDN